MAVIINKALYWLLLFAVMSIIQQNCLAASAKSSGTEDPKTSTDRVRIRMHDQIDKLKYKKYLMEIVETIKIDPKLYDIVSSDIMNMEFEKAAAHLNTAEGRIRTQLDEVKRVELTRIRKIGEELEKRGHRQQVIASHITKVSNHVNINNFKSFETEDLIRLLKQSHDELEKLDKLRKYRFKVYEMHKQLEFDELLKRMSPEEQKAIEKKKLEMFKKHRKSKPTYNPGSKEQLIHIWEERDQLHRENFNTKLFFQLHDLDDNGFLDEYEIKTIFKGELQEAYDEAGHDFDPVVRNEHLERMRERTFEAMDVNKDNLISVEELIENGKKSGVEDDHFMDTLQKTPIFTSEEYDKYAEQNREEINQMIDKGLITLPDSGVVKHNTIDASNHKDNQL